MAVKPISDSDRIKPFDIQAALVSLGKLDITEETTSNDANAAMKILGSFNQCIIGLVCFSGLTPWERHQDDELLYILEGEVELTVLGEDETRAVSLQVGSMFVVPRGLWHNQQSHQGVKLVFITSQEGNEESSDKDPRTNE